jgi:hypothetical protein
MCIRDRKCPFFRIRKMKIEPVGSQILTLNCKRETTDFNPIDVHLHHSNPNQNVEI